MEIKDFLFISNIDLQKETSTRKRIVRSLLIFFLILFLQFIWNYLYAIFADVSDTVIQNKKNTVSVDNSFFYMVLLGPIIEELTFRLSITSFNATYVKVSLSLIIGLVITILVPINLYSSYLHPYFFNTAISIVAFPFVWKVNMARIEIIWVDNFRSIVWGYIILFALVHALMYIDAGIEIQEVVRLVVSIGISSFLLSYTRFRFGIFYAVVIHVLNNLLQWYVIYRANQ